MNCLCGIYIYIDRGQRAFFLKWGRTEKADDLGGM